MKLFSIFIILTFIDLSCYSQKDWREGYYITNENDTVYGKILHLKRPSTWQMDFLTNEGKRELYDIKEIRGFYYDHTFYKRCETPVGSYFMKQIVTGQIKLYSINRVIYLQKGNDDVEKLNHCLEWDILKYYFSDNVELFTKIDNSKYDTLDIEQLIKEYNQWYTTNYIDEFSDAVSTSSHDINESNTTTLRKDSINKEILEQNLFNIKINILGTGAGIETKISNSTSLYIESGIDIELINYIYINPYIIVQPRIYTNIKKRFNEGKKITKFNGNYISPYFQLIYPITDLSQNPTNWYLFGLTYGLQRSKADRYYWGLDIGFGFLSYQDHTNFDQYTLKYTSRYLEPQFIYKLNLGFLF